ncbi:hypothetical protein ANN_26103 [Periplaneta americana]|uniref:Uncharacterized protein n=1 Tax=Periplaneta americana TaxID=6978 RepID=A0ABQ8S4Z7_PERAM|nr:hypothetical protein ANN_26103 [Periplaneta americana]
MEKDYKKWLKKTEQSGEETLKCNKLCIQDSGCHREPEALAPVLGSCPHGEVLRNSRHHRIRSMIAEQFRSINLQVFEEVHGLADNGSTDMVVIPPNKNNGYIIDPTIRSEKQKSQPEDVNRGKKRHLFNCPKTALNLTSDTNKAPPMRQLGQEIMG